MSTNPRKHSKNWLLASFVFWVACSAWSQAPFLRTGQVFLILQDGNTLEEFTIQPSYNSTNTSTIGALPFGGFDAIGFRRTDNLLYGVATANNHLYQVGQNANAQDLGDIGLDPALYYLAGDVSPDGRYFYAVGSSGAGSDVHLAKTDLETPGFPTQFITLSGVGNLADIAFDPTDGTLYGYDQTGTQVVTINPSTGMSSPFPPFKPGNTLYGLYFDAYGHLYGLGSTLYGVVDGFYSINKSTGKETRLTTGPSSKVSDMASCPYSVEMKSDVDPGVNLPCTEITYNYTLVNGSEETFSGVEFLHALPPGFHMTGVISNSFGAFIDTMSIPGSLRMENITLAPGTRNLSIKVSVGDIPKKRYNSQPIVTGLPPLYGNICRSDFTKEPGFEDSTAFIVNRFDQDSLEFRWLICQGETLVLESSEYGNNIHWNSGSTLPTNTVTKGGLYSFVAGNTCETIVVNNNVTSASCPFTISVDHVFIPDTIFACSDVVFRFILRNDSGEPRYNLSLSDTLPPFFTFVDIAKNTVGGTLKPNLAPNIFCLQGMDLKAGTDTVDLRVHLGTTPPGSYKSQGKLFGIPLVMGPLRFSDDPRTFKFDSSQLQVKGALSDSVFLPQIICAKTEITLDASSLGATFLWDDGSTGPRLVVNSPGNYHLTIFDGCEPADIYWDVVEGLPIAIDPLGPLDIHQGDMIILSPIIKNKGDSLGIQWFDNRSSLSCVDCPSPASSPLASIIYGLKVSNEQCSDSISVMVNVDEHRRIYAPNIFSPNEDGLNDYFSFQSPDFGKLVKMGIFDRWGNQVFQAKEAVLDTDSPQWDGRYKGEYVPAGVYIWWAEIEFIDGKRQVFTGDVSVLR